MCIYYMNTYLHIYIYIERERCVMAILLLLSVDFLLFSTLCLNLTGIPSDFQHHFKGGLTPCHSCLVSVCSCYCCIADDLVCCS